MGAITECIYYKEFDNTEYISGIYCNKFGNKTLESNKYCEFINVFQKNKITKNKLETKELKMEKSQTRSEISLKETIQKIVKESRERGIDSHINIGSIDLYSADEIANAGFRHLLIVDKCLFVECTESNIHHTAKTLLSLSFSCENNGGSRIDHSNELNIPYHNKYTCGAVQNKYMDACIYVVAPNLIRIVANEVGYKGQNLVGLCKVLANYLIPGSTIEVTVNLWIPSESQKSLYWADNKKIQKEIRKTKEAVEDDSYQRYNNQCVRNTSIDFFGNNDNGDNNKFHELKCELLDQLNFSPANLGTDFNYEKTFTDYSAEQRHFKILFKALYKRKIFQMWSRKNQRNTRSNPIRNTRRN